MAPACVVADDTRDLPGYIRRCNMLPEAQYNPSSAFEDSCGLLIPMAVRCDFGGPVVSIGYWWDVMLWASVPVAAVDENGHARAGEEEIRRPAQIRLRPSVHPVSKPHAVH